MAAAGSAVGLGNIWGFPSRVANNGGAAFVLVYLIFTLLIVYPALLAELAVGRHTRSNPVNAFHKIKGGEKYAFLGFLGLICHGLILSFYSVVGGWIVAHFCRSLLFIFGGDSWADFLDKGLYCDLCCTSLFFLATIGIVVGGLHNGIERWAKILMPLLILLLLCLIGYVLTLEGASQGVRVYLVPDFSKVFDVDLMIKAMGQAFFSASLGGGAMLVYGSYLSEEQKLIQVGAYVLLFDFCIAFLAGLLIIPAMYAAKEIDGIAIFDEKGGLLGGSNIALEVLPALFGTMGIGGHLAMAAFFLLLSVAALTSSISMLEVQVAYATDNKWIDRKGASWLIGAGLWSVSLLLIFYFDLLFGIVIKVTTQYLQPGLNIIYCILLGWVLEKSELIKEFKKGAKIGAHGKLLKILPIFFKYIIPLAVGGLWIRGILS